MKLNIISVLSIVMFACSGEPSTQETIDFDELAGETGVETVDTVVIDTTNLLDLSTYSGRLMNAMKDEYEADTNAAFHVMDRYSFNTSEKFMLTKKETVSYGSNEVTPVAEFYYYSFADTIKTNNAFYNYLDDLSANGESDPIKLNEELEHLKSPPLFMMVYDTVIVSANFACEHKSNNWSPLRDSMLSIYGKDYRYFIDVQCGGPLRWK